MSEYNRYILANICALFHIGWILDSIKNKNKNGVDIILIRRIDDIML